MSDSTNSGTTPDPYRITPGEAFEGAMGAPDGAMGGSTEKP